MAEEGDRMRTVVILIILLVLFTALICYSALVVASRADEWEREEWERREDEQIHKR